TSFMCAPQGRSCPELFPGSLFDCEPNGYLVTHLATRRSDHCERGTSRSIDGEGTGLECASPLALFPRPTLGIRPRPLLILAASLGLALKALGSELPPPGFRPLP